MRKVAVLVILLLASCGGVLRAQSTNASITGRVTDPSKAVIADAKVAVISVDTNVRYEGATNGSGEYYLTNLPPRSYRIEIEKTGFKKLIKPDVILHVQDSLELNFEMTLGSGSESITVEAGAPVVNTQSAAVSTVIDRTFGRCELFHDRWGQRQFRRNWLLSPCAECWRSATRAERFGRHQQPGVGGFDAGVSHPNLFVCPGIRTHARRADFHRDALRNG